MTKTTCSVAACGKINYRSGWCVNHYKELRVKTVCSIEGCEKLAKQRGWCPMHAMRWKEHGDPNYQPADNLFIEFERLADLETDDCVLWPYGLVYGYGKLWVKGKTVRTHRVALARRIPPPDESFVACHTPGIGCQRNCLNYRHLRWDTQRSNCGDTLANGTRMRGEKHPHNKLKEYQVWEILGRYNQEGWSINRLRKHYSVNSGTIHDIVHGGTWQWMTATEQ